MLPTLITAALAGIALFGLIALLVETDHDVSAGAVLIAAAVGVSWLTGDSVLAFMANNLGLMAVAVVVYLAAGLGWAYVKWQLYLHGDEFGEVFNRAQQEFTVARVGERGADFKEFFHRRYKSHTASGKKRRIVGWMAWWPFSLFSFFAVDALRAVYRRLYASFAGLFSSAMDSRLDRGVD